MKLLISFAVVVAAPAGVSLLRRELMAIAIGVVLLSFGGAGTTVFFLRKRSGDRSLIYFSVFSLLYAIRLIFRQRFFQLLVAMPQGFWRYSDMVIDNYIVVPLTLFLIEIVPAAWKRILKGVLVFQVAFATARFFSQALHIGERPVEVVYHLVIVGYCLLLIYPFVRVRRMSREFKVISGGFAIFGVFVVHSNLVDLHVIGGRGIESVGFLAFACCMGYVAAVRAYSNEQRLLSLHKELEIAGQIQNSILPRGVPQLAGVEIAARYVPMTAVAGDFYDFLVVDEKQVGILVADVTGHGVPAALIASMLKSGLAAQSSHAGDPAKVLAGLNQALCGKFEEHFVTAGYLFVDGEKRTLRYAGAGHPPMLFGSTNSGKHAGFREVEANGLLLGIAEGAEYAPVEISFGPGDRCILYTDGVVEAKNPAQEEFGATRLRKFVETQGHLAVDALIAAALAEVERWSGRGERAIQEDDITLVAVDFGPTGSVHAG